MTREPSRSGLDVAGGDSRLESGLSAGLGLMNKHSILPFGIPALEDRGTVRS